MKLLRTFGLGGKKLIAAGRSVTGTVTEVKRCWWLKINTKPVRVDGFDGAVFPNMIHFTYRVGGVSYQGSRYVGLSSAFPRKGEPFTVFYDERHPSRWAVLL